MTISAVMNQFKLKMRSHLILAGRLTLARIYYKDTVSLAAKSLKKQIDQRATRRDSVTKRPENE